MKLLARFAPLAVALLPASVGTASAECAWVLWESWSLTGRVGNEMLPVEGGYNLEEVYPTREECEVVKAAYIASWLQKGLKVENGVAQAKVQLDKSGSGEALMLRSHRCLPDTVDPRGPKGK